MNITPTVRRNLGAQTVRFSSFGIDPIGGDGGLGDEDGFRLIEASRNCWHDRFRRLGLHCRRNSSWLCPLGKLCAADAILDK